MDRKSVSTTRSDTQSVKPPPGPQAENDYDLRGGYGGRRPAVQPAAGVDAMSDPAGPHFSTGWRVAVISGGLLCLPVAVIAVLAFRLGTSSSSSTRTAATTTTAPTTATTLPVTDIYQRPAPSVVLITTSKGSLAWFVGVGGLLVALAVGLSPWWNRIRVPRPLGSA